MSSVFVRIAKLTPIVYRNGFVELTLFRFEDLSWGEKKLEESLNIDKLFTETQNFLTRFMQTNKVTDGYVVVEIEGIGLKASRCEGSITGSPRPIYLIPQPLRRVTFYKKKGEELTKVYELTFQSEYWVYDGQLVTNNLDWDVMLIETAGGRRVISREELLEPAKLVVEKRKKKRRKRRSRVRKAKGKSKKRRRGRAKRGR